MSTPDGRGQQHATLPLPKVLQLFWVLSAVALALTVLVAFFEHRAGWAFVGWWPLMTPPWGDLLLYVDTFRLVHTAAFFDTGAVERVSYPPLGAALYSVMYASGHAVLLYLSIAAAWLVAAWLAACRALVRYGVGATTAALFLLTVLAASFPIARMISEGNLELFVWTATAAGTWAFLRGQDGFGGWNLEAAGVLWGLAAAMKLYPAVLLLLMMSRGRKRALLAGAATFVTATLLSLAYLGPTLGVALRGSVANLTGFTAASASEWTMRELVANHSTFMLLKFAAAVAGRSAAPWTLPYYLCGALGFLVVFVLRVRRLPVANQVLAVTLCMVMLPTLSFWHTLVHLYAPWLMLSLVAVRAERSGVTSPGVRTTLLMFLPLFASFTLYTYTPALLFGGLLQSVWMVALMVRVLAVPLGPERPAEATL